MRISDSTIRPDTPSRTPSPITEKKSPRALTTEPHAIRPDHATFSSSFPYPAIASQSKREADATVSDRFAPSGAPSQAASSKDPFQGVPQAAIEDSGVPDLYQLPKLNEGPNALQELEQKAKDFWDPYPPPESGLTPRQCQYQRASSSLTTEADVRTRAGLLSPQGNQ
ncbi:hypothetical protein DWU98_17530, partial [Dyella monticola]